MVKIRLLAITQEVEDVTKHHRDAIHSKFITCFASLQGQLRGFDCSTLQRPS